jgi:hypothetical protein
MRTVKRNAHRFSVDFVFNASGQQLRNLKSQVVTLGSGGSRYLPMVSSEHGGAMLSSALRIAQAVEVSFT